MTASSDRPPLGLVVLVSGSGSNLQALIDASAHDAAPFRVVAVGADRDGTGDAMAHGVKVTGCTCHWVDVGVDTGPIIDQRAVRVEPDDSVETLHERIKVLEREMLVDVVRGLAADRSWQ